MEHRNGRRVKLTIPVELWHGGHCLRECISYDFGQGGLGLFGGDASALREGDLVTVKVAAGASMDERPAVRKAMLVYQGGDRLGLMWADIDPGFDALLTAGETIAA